MPDNWSIISRANRIVPSLWMVHVTLLLHNFGRFWFRLREIIQKLLFYFIISKLVISVNQLGECKSQSSDRSWGYNWKTVAQFESEIMQRAILEERNYNQRISISTLGDSVNQLGACKSRSSERFWDFIGTRPWDIIKPGLRFRPAT